MVFASFRKLDAANAAQYSRIMSGGLGTSAKIVHHSLNDGKKNETNR
jgi:hypothetical protein